MSDAMKPMKLHIWCPNLSGSRGGIQVYSTFLLAALLDLQADIQFEVFTKHDGGDRKYSDALLNAPPQGFHSSGKWSSVLRTSAFATQIVGYALLERPDLII